MLHWNFSVGDKFVFTAWGVLVGVVVPGFNWHRGRHHLRVLFNNTFQHSKDKKKFWRYNFNFLTSFSLALVHPKSRKEDKQVSHHHEAVTAVPDQSQCFFLVPEISIPRNQDDSLLMILFFTCNARPSRILRSHLTFRREDWNNEADTVVLSCCIEYYGNSNAISDPKKVWIWVVWVPSPPTLLRSGTPPPWLRASPKVRHLQPRVGSTLRTITNAADQSQPIQDMMVASECHRLWVSSTRVCHFTHEWVVTEFL